MKIERESLIERYSSLADGELFDLYEEKEALVEQARDLLMEEIKRRNLMDEAVKELDVRQKEKLHAEASSGQGRSSVLPQELSGWNWGAFLLSWIWGLRHKTYIALLVFIPGVGIIMAFVLGAKGNEWAWKNNTWASIEHFKKTQSTWAKWGMGIYIALFVIMGFMAFVKL